MISLSDWLTTRGSLTPTQIKDLDRELAETCIDMTKTLTEIINLIDAGADFNGNCHGHHGNSLPLCRAAHGDDMTMTTWLVDELKADINGNFGLTCKTPLFFADRFDILS